MAKQLSEWQKLSAPFQVFLRVFYFTSGLPIWAFIILFTGDVRVCDVKYLLD